MDDTTLLILTVGNAIEIMEEAQTSGLKDSYSLGRHSAAEEILDLIIRSADEETAEMVRANKARAFPVN